MSRKCFRCKGAEMVPETRVRELGRDRLPITLVTGRCPLCDCVAPSSAQHSENIARIKATGLTRDDLLAGGNR